MVMIPYPGFLETKYVTTRLRGSTRIIFEEMKNLPVLNQRSKAPGVP